MSLYTARAPSAIPTCDSSAASAERPIDTVIRSSKCGKTVLGLDPSPTSYNAARIALATEDTVKPILNSSLGPPEMAGVAPSAEVMKSTLLPQRFHTSHHVANSDGLIR